MNKEQIEKMFDEFYYERIVNSEIIEDFIFDTVIPEVLESVMPEENQAGIATWKYTECIEDIKQKAKELYNITL